MRVSGSCTNVKFLLVFNVLEPGTLGASQMIPNLRIISGWLWKNHCRPPSRRGGVLIDLKNWEQNVHLQSQIQSREHFCKSLLRVGSCESVLATWQDNQLWICETWESFVSPPHEIYRKHYNGDGEWVWELRWAASTSHILDENGDLERLQTNRRDMIKSIGSVVGNELGGAIECHFISNKQQLYQRWTSHMMMMTSPMSARTPSHKHAILRGVGEEGDSHIRCCLEYPIYPESTGKEDVTNTRKTSQI